MQSNLNTSTNELSVLDRLKQETQSNHTSIEKVSCMKRLFAKNYTKEEYRDFLAKMYGYYDVIEPTIFAELGDSLRPQFQGRSKLNLIAQDMLSLGLTPKNIADLPRYNLPPYINSLPQCLGVWYVLEGSTLGGQIISKHLTSYFGESANDFMCFQKGYGEHTRARWMAFCQIVSRQITLEHTEEVEQMVQAAKSTFDQLGDWLDK